MTSTDPAVTVPEQVDAQRRNGPVRTGLGGMAIPFDVILLAAGANDILAITFHLSINAITETFRVLIFLVPLSAYEVTKRICLGLQLCDRETVFHGRETDFGCACPAVAWSSCSSHSRNPSVRAAQQLRVSPPDCR